MPGLRPDLLERLYDLIEEAQDLDERVWETLSVDEIAANVAPGLRELANRAIAVLEGVLEYIDVYGESPEIQTEQSGIADIAFMARWDLQRRLREFGMGLTIAGADGRDRWVALARCSSLRRRVIKSLCELERARCAALGVGFRFEGTCCNDRKVAIATRTAYRAFTRHVRGTAARLEAGHVDLGRALRLAAVAVAVLIGQPIYAELRIDDREQLRSLQARLFAAVRGGDEFWQRRVWADIAAFAELLVAVERRPELLAHDYELVCETLARLAALRPGEAIEPAWRARLALIEGRDAELDALLADPARPAFTTRLAAVLLELADALGRALGRDSHGSLRPALDGGLALVPAFAQAAARPS